MREAHSIEKLENQKKSIISKFESEYAELSEKFENEYKLRSSSFEKEYAELQSNYEREYKSQNSILENEISLMKESFEKRFELFQREKEQNIQNLNLKYEKEISRIESLIRKEKERTGAGPELLEAVDLASAVKAAQKHTPTGGIVLLSPAAPSYGIFNSFEERGKIFRKLAGWK